MAFTDFKSIAQVQEEYNIKYREENFIDYVSQVLPTLLKNLILTWTTLMCLYQRPLCVKMLFIRLSVKSIRILLTGTRFGAINR